MDSFEAFMADLESRGIRVTLHPGGKLTAGPSGKLDNAVRANLARYKPDLVRLLTKRSQSLRPARYLPPRKAPGPHPKDSAVCGNSDHPPGDPGFSPADTKTIANVVEALDASLVSVGPPRQYTPAALATAPPAAGEGEQPQRSQLPLFTSDPADEAPDESGASADPIEDQPSSDTDSAAEPNPEPLEPSQPIVAEALEPELVATHDEPEPSLGPPTDVTPEQAQTADAADDPEQSGDEISAPPAPYDANATNTDWSDTSYVLAARAPDRRERMLLWLVVENVRDRRTGRPAFRLKLAPASSTDPSAVRFTVEETSAAVDPFRLLVEPTNLKRGGFRLVRHATGLRVGIEVSR